MQTQLMTDGPTLSRIVPGMMRLNDWQLTADALHDWIKACLDLSVTTFDHADIYGGYTCEARFGDALALEAGLRHQMQIVTKCGIALMSENRPQNTIKHYDTTKDYIIQSAETSLSNLHTDYLDVLLLHRPDPLMDADDVADAFHTLIRDGKVRHVGVSNFTPAQFALLESRLNVPLVTNQVEFSLLHMEPAHDGTFDDLQMRRTRPMIWSPLGGGGIFNPHDERTTRLNAELQAVAAELGGAGLDQVALVWVLAHPVGVVPVLGTGKLERIRASVEALELDLSRQQWFRLWQAAAGTEVP